MAVPEYIPIDVWAETKHPDFLKNVQAHVGILCNDWTEEERYALVRGIMQYTRQEFEKR